MDERRQRDERNREKERGNAARGEDRNTKTNKRDNTRRIHPIGQ
jgi:hypothetical protein